MRVITILLPCLPWTAQSHITHSVKGRQQNYAQASREASQKTGDTVSRHGSSGASRQYHADSSYFLPTAFKVLGKHPSAFTPIDAARSHLLGGRITAGDLNRHALKQELVRGKLRRGGASPVMSGEDAKDEQKEKRAADRKRLIDAIFGSQAEFEKKLAMQYDTSIPSHMKVELDEDGEPKGLRFVNVDELECIGCTNCATVAKQTFFMEDEAGRARVFSQGTDDPELVEEAIDTCPVDCISYVSFEDLVILESEREGLFGDEGQFIDQRTIGFRGVSDGYASRPFKTMSSGKELDDKNPEYLKRLAEQEAEKEKSGEAKREAEDARRQQMVDDLFEGAAEADRFAGATMPDVDGDLSDSTDDALNRNNAALGNNMPVDGSSEGPDSPG